MSVHKKISAQSVQPFGRLLGTYMYECLVLLYRFNLQHKHFVFKTVFDLI